jgi:hypothetical protein
MSASDKQLIEQLFERLAKPVMPVSVDLWDTAHVAAYLKRSVDNVRKEIVCLPSFPRPVRLPVHGKAQALYKARDVIKWAESYTS